MKALWRIVARLLAGFLAAGYLLSPVALIYAQVNTAPHPTCFISVSTSVINVGGSVTVKWTSTDAVSGAITNIGNVGPRGSINLLPPSTGATYFGAFTGPGGTANCSASVSVNTTSGGGTATTQTTDAAGNPVNVGTAIQTTTAAPTTGGTPALGLVPCGVGGFVTGDGNNTANNSTGCQACDLPKLIQNIINFAIGLSIPIAAALFAWAGVLFFTAADNTAKITQAKQIFKNAFIGFVIAITAWIVINTVLVIIFSNSHTFTSGSWFTIQCAPVGSRPVNGDINSVLGILSSSGSVNTSGSPSGGSGGAGGTGSGSAGSGSDSGAGVGSGSTVANNISDADQDVINEAVQKACDDGDKQSCAAAANSSTILTTAAQDQLLDQCEDDNDTASCNALDAALNSNNSANIQGVAAANAAANQAALDTAQDALQAACEDDNDQAACKALGDGLTKKLTDAQIDALGELCDEGDTSVCNALDTAVDTPGSPSQNVKGDCTASAMQSDGWSNAAQMSCVTKFENGSCNLSAPSGTDIGQDGNSVSIGKFQVNISANNMNYPACEALNNGQPLNCTQAFSGGSYTAKNHNTTVSNQSLYNTCVTAASDNACNTAAGQAIYNSQGIRAWGTAAQNACGGITN